MTHPQVPSLLPSNSRLPLRLGPSVWAYDLTYTPSTHSPFSASRKHWWLYLCKTHFLLSPVIWLLSPRMQNRPLAQAQPSFLVGFMIRLWLQSALFSLTPTPSPHSEAAIPGILPSLPLLPSLLGFFPPLSLTHKYTNYMNLHHLAALPCLWLPPALLQFQMCVSSLDK